MTLRKLPTARPAKPAKILPVMAFSQMVEPTGILVPGTDFPPTLPRSCQSGTKSLPIPVVRFATKKEKLEKGGLCENHMALPTPAEFCRRGRLLHKILIYSASLWLRKDFRRGLKRKVSRNFRAVCSPRHKKKTASLVAGDPCLISGFFGR